MGVLTHIAIYPVKSMQSIKLTESNVFDSNLEHDRIAVVTDVDGHFISGRTHPLLLSLKCIVDDKELTIQSEEQGKINVKFSEFSAHKEPMQIWNRLFLSYIAPIRMNQFLSNILKDDVQLRWIGDATDRTTSKQLSLSLSCADSYPFMLINRASFIDLQNRCEHNIKIDQFRANFVMDCEQPFIEDSWKVIQIGDVIFDVIKACKRCMMINIDLDDFSYHQKNEPLSTLGKFRKNEQGEIDFGIMLKAKNNGKIKLNDKMIVLETKKAVLYKNEIKEREKMKKNKITIKYQQHEFIGNTETTILEQLEEHGISIPYSCRVGMCRRCRVVLESGEITPKVSSAINSDTNEILTCTCVPKTDVVLK